jgi:hypothetical protein
MRVAIVYTVRDGLIVRGQEFASREEALKALGFRTSALDEKQLSALHGKRNSVARYSVGGCRRRTLRSPQPQRLRVKKAVPLGLIGLSITRQA